MSSDSESATQESTPTELEAQEAGALSDAAAETDELDSSGGKSDSDVAADDSKVDTAEKLLEERRMVRGTTRFVFE